MSVLIKNNINKEQKIITNKVILLLEKINTANIGYIFEKIANIKIKILVT
tara:strand:+ start:341 stop:490 length:150 start_codon:yes stop_codon:yes gene_type:complete